MLQDGPLTSSDSSPAIVRPSLAAATPQSPPSRHVQACVVPPQDQGRLSSLLRRTDWYLREGPGLCQLTSRQAGCRCRGLVRVPTSACLPGVPSRPVPSRPVPPRPAPSRPVPPCFLRAAPRTGLEEGSRASRVGSPPCSRTATRSSKSRHRRRRRRQHHVHPQHQPQQHQHQRQRQPQSQHHRHRLQQRHRQQRHRHHQQQQRHRTSSSISSSSSSSSISSKRLPAQPTTPVPTFAPSPHHHDLPVVCTILDSFTLFVVSARHGLPLAIVGVARRPPSRAKEHSRQRTTQAR
jgi:hypothetical protein